MGKSSRVLQTFPEQHMQRSCGGREQGESEEKEEASMMRDTQGVCVYVCEHMCVYILYVCVCTCVSVRVCIYCMCVCVRV